MKIFKKGKSYFVSYWLAEFGTGNTGISSFTELMETDFSNTELEERLAALYLKETGTKAITTIIFYQEIK